MSINVLFAFNQNTSKPVVTPTARSTVCAPSKPTSQTVLTHTQEAKSGIFDLKEAEPAAIRSMMIYFYYGEYTKDPKFPKIPESARTKKRAWEALDKTDEPPSNLLVHVKVYATSLYFLAEGLKDLSLKHFVNLAQVHCGTPDFLSAVDEIYSSGSDDVIRISSSGSFSSAAESSISTPTSSSARSCLSGG